MFINLTKMLLFFDKTTMYLKARTDIRERKFVGF